MVLFSSFWPLLIEIFFQSRLLAVYSVIYMSFTNSLVLMLNIRIVSLFHSNVNFKSMRRITCWKCCVVVLEVKVVAEDDIALICLKFQNIWWTRTRFQYNGFCKNAKKKPIRGWICHYNWEILLMNKIYRYALHILTGQCEWWTNTTPAMGRLHNHLDIIGLCHTVSHTTPGMAFHSCFHATCHTDVQNPWKNSFRWVQKF